jgi:hypothetical protein
MNKASIYAGTEPKVTLDSTFDQWADKCLTDSDQNSFEAEEFNRFLPHFQTDGKPFILNVLAFCFLPCAFRVHAESKY